MLTERNRARLLPQPFTASCPAGATFSGRSPRKSVATFRRKNDVSSGPRVVPDRSEALPECALVLPRAFFRRPREVLFPSRRRTALSIPPACQNSSHIDVRVCHHPASDPPFHPFLSPIAAAVEPVPSFEHADPALAPRPPFLPLAEPAFLLVLASGRAVGRTIRDRDPLHPQRVCLPLIFRGVKTSITSQPLGRPPQPLPMQAHRCQQQGRVGRPLPAHRIVGNNLILGFLYLHQLAELGRLAHFALADDFRRGFEHAHDLARRVGDTSKNPRGGLSQHLVDQGNHRIQLSFYPPQYRLLFLIRRSLHSAVNLLGEPLRLVPYLSRQPHQLPVFLLHLLFLLLALAPAEPGNLHHPVSDRAQPIPQSCPLFSDQVADLFHDPGQHPRPIPQQTAVGWVMHVHFCHGCHGQRKLRRYTTRLWDG